MIVLKEHTTLPVDVAVRAVDKVVGGVVGVGRAETVQDHLAVVGHVVPIGVLEKDQVRLGSDEHPTVPELKTERVVNASEFLALVSHAITISVLKDHQRILHFLERLPLRIGRPDGGPKTALRIHLHLDRVHHFREHCFVSKKVDLVALRKGHLGNAFFATEVIQRTFLACIGTLRATTDIGDHRNCRWHIAVTEGMLFGLGCGPNGGVAIGAHDVKHGQLVLKHVSIGLTVDKLQSSAGTPDIVSVNRAVAVEPVPVLVLHRIANRLVGSGFHGATLSRKRVGNDSRYKLLPKFIEVNPIDGERIYIRRVKFLAGIEEIHESHP